MKPMFDFWQSLLAALERLAMLPSLIHSVFPSLRSRKRARDAVRTYDRTMDDLLREIQTLLESPLEPAKLLHMSARLQDQFAPKLQQSDICMLPSYNHKLPSGLEHGTYLALDVGGSTFRVAMVQLTGKQPGAKSMRIVTMKSYKIDEAVRSLQGNAFFDWMAEKVEAALADSAVETVEGVETFGMGLAWSFPIEYVVSQTISNTSANIQQTNIEPQWKSASHGQRLPRNRRHSWAGPERAGYDVVQEEESSRTYGVNSQRLVCNIIVTCLRGSFNTIRSNPRNRLQHCRPFARFSTCSDQVQRVPTKVARRSVTCTCQHRTEHVWKRRFPYNPVG
jgi:hypothetical protein